MVDFHCKNLPRTPLGGSRLRSPSRPAKNQPRGFYPYIDFGPVHASEVKTYLYAVLATISIHWGPPTLRLRILRAGKPIGTFKLTIKPFEFDDFFQGILPVYPQIASCMQKLRLDSFLLRCSTLLPVPNFVKQNASNGMNARLNAISK
jgi:hypothetical protein